SILFKRWHIESLLPFEEQRYVFKEFALRMSSIRRLGCLARIRVHGEQKISNNKSHFIFINFLRFIQHRMHGRAGRALEISKFHYSNSRCRGTCTWIVVSADCLNWRGRLRNKETHVGSLT